MTRSRILTLMRQDMLLSHRNHLVSLTAIILLLMVGLIWLLPESLDSGVDEVIYDASQGAQLERYLRQAGAEGATFVQSDATLRAALSESNRGIGVVFEGDVQDPQFRLLTVGRVAEENVNLLRATLDTVIRAMRGAAQEEGFTVQLLREPGPPVPLNLSVVPVALVFEVVLLGFFFGAVMIFQEKQEGVNRAYRVSPATTLDYLLSKTTLFTALSVVYGALLLLAAFQLQADYARVLMLVALTSAMMTLLGLAIAVFFNNISEWFFVGLAVLLINLLPVLSYGMPAFAPRWLTLIPSYPVLFGVREILFPTGATGFMTPLLLQLLAFNVVAFALCYLALDRKLMKAG